MSCPCVFVRVLIWRDSCKAVACIRHGLPHFDDADRKFRGCHNDPAISPVEALFSLLRGRIYDVIDIAE